jgi:hypothetical protein
LATPPVIARKPKNTEYLSKARLISPGAVIISVVVAVLELEQRRRGAE